MEMQIVLKTLFQEFSKAFLDTFLKNAGFEFEESERRARQIDCRIYCNQWLEKILKALLRNKISSDCLRDLPELMLDFAHIMCTNPMNIIKVQREELNMVHSLEYYPPKEVLIAALKYNAKRNSMIDNYVSNSQNCKNSIGFFHMLLELEDLEELQGYVRFTQSDVYLQSIGSKAFRFTLDQCAFKNIKGTVTPNLDEVIIVPGSTRFDATKFNCIMRMVYCNQKNGVAYRGLVTKIEKSVIEFEFRDENIKVKMRYEDPVNVIFCPARHSIRYQNRALDLLSKHTGIQKYLNPSYLRNPMPSIQVVTQLKLFNDQIANNPEQLKAVHTIVSGPNTRMPFIIFGPPGTGKTTTIVETILQLRLQQPKSRILVAAGSNSACDTIAARLCDWEKSPSYQNFLAKTTTYPMLRIFASEILRRGTTNLSEALTYRSNVAWNNGQHAYPAIKDIHKYGIVVTTLCTVGKLVCGNVNENNYFTHVFIDEAGASSESEALLGIMGIKNDVDSESCCVILSGDYKQLGPVIKSQMAEKHGLGQSLMERLLKTECYAVNENGQYDCSVQTRLVRNYRSHPEIVKLYNHLFYNNELIAMKSEQNDVEPKWSFLPNPQYPIAFQVVNGDMCKSDTKSSSNLLEIDALMAFILIIIENHKIQKSDIGVITPYNLQCKLIRERLDSKELFEVEVGSVAKFQGREKLVILASMVRSDSSLGFVKCPRRINVLLSRPISLLIILGDPDTLNTSENLAFVIHKCKENGNYLDETKNILNLDDTTLAIKKIQKTEPTQRSFVRRAYKPFKKSDGRL